MDVSSPSSNTPTVTPANNKFWLKDPLSSFRNMQVTCIEGIDEKRVLLAGTFFPRGNLGTSVVVSESAYRGAEFTATFRVFSKAEDDELSLLISPGITLLLQDPVGRQLYCRPSEAPTRELLRGQRQSDGTRGWLYNLHVPLTEVARPEVT